MNAFYADERETAGDKARRKASASLGARALKDRCFKFRIALIVVPTDAHGRGVEEVPPIATSQAMSKPIQF